MRLMTACFVAACGLPLGACGGAAQSGGTLTPSASTVPVAYEEVSVPTLVMMKPNGKHVRTSGAWGGAQPNIAGVAPDAFGVHFYDGATIIALSVPKSLAAEAEHFTHGQAVTVEGRFEDRAPFPIVHVDRFVEVAP